MILHLHSHYYRYIINRYLSRLNCNSITRWRSGSGTVYPEHPVSLIFIASSLILIACTLIRIINSKVLSRKLWLIISKINEQQTSNSNGAACICMIYSTVGHELSPTKCLMKISLNIKCKIFPCETWMILLWSHKKLSLIKMPKSAWIS